MVLFYRSGMSLVGKFTNSQDDYFGPKYHDITGPVGVEKLGTYCAVGNFLKDKGTLVEQHDKILPLISGGIISGADYLEIFSLGKFFAANILINGFGALAQKVYVGSLVAGEGRRALEEIKRNAGANSYSLMEYWIMGDEETFGFKDRASLEDISRLLQISS